MTQCVPFVPPDDAVVLLDLVVSGVVVLVSALCGAGATWWLMSPQIHLAETRAIVATDRLFSAWRDGYTVPLMPEPASTPTAPVPAFSEVVEDWISQFDLAGQQVYTAKARRLRQQEPSMSDSDLIRALERSRVSVLDAPYGMNPDAALFP